MRKPYLYIWRKAPFIRIFIALVSGILIQWHLQLRATAWFSILLVCAGLSVLLFYIPLVTRYRLGYFNGALLLICFAAFGAVLTWKNDIRNSDGWLGRHYDSAAAVVVTLEEKPVEKTNSFKANASVSEMFENGRTITTKTNATSRFVQNSNYVNAESINLSYQFPAKPGKSSVLNNTRIGFTVNDIQRWSSIEVERGTQYPFARNFTVNFSTQF